MTVIISHVCKSDVDGPVLSNSTIDEVKLKVVRFINDFELKVFGNYFCLLLCYFFHHTLFDSNINSQKWFIFSNATVNWLLIGSKDKNRRIKWNTNISTYNENYDRYSYEIPTFLFHIFEKVLYLFFIFYETYH